MVYKKNYGISIPTIAVFPEYEENRFPIALDENHFEPLLQVIHCTFQYTTINNKLVKQYLKYVREYYAYLVEFDSKFIEQFHPFCIKEQVYTPMIMKLDEVIDYAKTLYSQKRGKIMALEMLNQKMNDQIS